MKGRIVLVGSRGRMGDMLLRRARAAGLDVTPLDISDDQPAAEAFGVAVPGRGTALFAPDAVAAACRGAELVLLCVPAAALKETAALLSPHLPPSAVLSDIVSVKEQPMRQMCEVWPHAVVGTHPLFGPRPAEGEELPVAVTPAADVPDEAVRKVEDFFTALGCRCFRTTAQAHDRAMARVQNMNFITTLAYFALLAGDEELLPYITPSFRRRQAAARKMLTEDGAMFCALFEANPYSHEAVRQYRQMLNVAAGGDIDLLCRRARWWWREEEGTADGEDARGKAEPSA